jgi:[ribosomal protein S5]-alanine N-acetyltransferase
MHNNALKLVEITRSGVPATGAPPVGIVTRDIALLMSALYAREGFVTPWVGYLALNDNTYVGMCAFKSPPNSNRVEIAVQTFPEYEGRGIGTQMARQLIMLARQAQPAVIIAAQTLPEKNASTAVLEKSGFELVGELELPDDGVVWEWRHRG